jgi:peptidoglycan/LPS O-acetylase OafA/YrhL
MFPRLVAGDVDQPATTMHEINGRIAHERVGHPLQRAGQIIIVAVDVRQDRACRPLQPLVDRVCLPPILFADPVRQVLFVPLDDVDTAVGAAAVDDDVFEIRITLREDAVDGLFEVGGLLVGGGDDGDAGTFSVHDIFGIFCKPIPGAINPFLRITMSYRLPEHLPSLDGLRGLATLAVVLIHAAQASKQFGLDPSSRWEQVFFGTAEFGWAGVDLFFVLSGFLITGILYDTKEHAHYFRNFYLRRTVRIFPLYYVVVLVRLMPWPALPQLGLGQTAGALFYSINVWQSMQLLGSARHDPVLGPTWSLAVEEQFYLVWPIVVWLCPRRFLVPICLILIPFGFACRWTCFRLGLDSWAAYSLTPCRLDAFSFGAMIAILMRHRDPVSLAPYAHFGMVAAALGMATIFWRGDGDTSYAGRRMALYGYPLIELFFACLLVVAVVGSRASSWFSVLPLRFLGKYSYAIYLFHYPLLTVGLPYVVDYLPERAHSSPRAVAAVILFAVDLAVASALAFVSWHLYEKHFLKLKKHFPR